MPDRTVNVPYYARSNVRISGTPGQTYYVDLQDIASRFYGRINGSNQPALITLDAAGLGMVELGSAGVMGSDPLTPEFRAVNLRVRPVRQDNPTLPDLSGPTAIATAEYVQHSWWTRLWDAAQSFLGGDPGTGTGVAANFAGGMLIIGDIGSLVKNWWRSIGGSNTPPNYTEAALSGLGLATELAVGAGELADAPISGVRSLLAALGNLPAGKVLPVLYRRFLSNAADMAQFVRFIPRVVGNDVAFQVLKEVLTTEEVMTAAIRASDELGDGLFTSLKNVSSLPDFGGTLAAQQITKLCANLSGNALAFFKNLSPADLERSVEHMGVVLAAGKIDVAMIEKLLTKDEMFSEAYTRLGFLEDLRLVSNSQGLEGFANTLVKQSGNFLDGRVYELHAAATIAQSTGGTVTWIAKQLRTPTGQFDGDFDFIISGVYYQAKRGSVGSKNSIRRWLGKARADGATAAKYVTPGGEEAVPASSRSFLGDAEKNGFDASVQIIDVERVP